MAFTIRDVADHKQVNGALVALTDAEKQILVDEWNEPDARTYEQKRQAEYPPIKELIVALWENVVEERASAVVSLEAKRQAVKTKYPKP